MSRHRARGPFVYSAVFCFFPTTRQAAMTATMPVSAIAMKANRAPSRNASAIAPVESSPISDMSGSKPRAISTPVTIDDYTAMLEMFPALRVTLTSAPVVLVEADPPTSSEEVVFGVSHMPRPIPLMNITPTMIATGVFSPIVE